MEIGERELIKAIEAQDQKIIFNETDDEWPTMRSLAKHCP